MLLVPQMIVYKRKRMLHDLKKSLPHGSLVTMSDTGAQIKIYFRFGCSILMHTVKVQLLILNGHGSHVKATDALKYAEKHNITIICLPPPHTTHHTQPLDVSFLSHWRVTMCRVVVGSRGWIQGRSSLITNFNNCLQRPMWQRQVWKLPSTVFVNENAVPQHVFEPSQTSDQPLQAQGKLFCSLQADVGSKCLINQISRAYRCKSWDQHFQQQCFNEFPWLHFDASANGVLCFIYGSAARQGSATLAKCKKDSFSYDWRSTAGTECPAVHHQLHSVSGSARISTWWKGGRWQKPHSSSSTSR